MTIRPNTIRAETIRPNTIRAETIRPNTIRPTTITSDTPRSAPSNPTPQPAASSSTSAPRPRKKSRGSFSFVAPTPLIPKPEPPVRIPPINTATIKHNPGAISQEKLVEARSNFKPVEDIITVQVVGSNFSTGEAIVRDGGGNTYNVQVGRAALSNAISPSGSFGSGPSVIPGQSAIISRSRSQDGERTVRLLSIIPLGQDPRDFLGALGTDQNFNELCRPSQEAQVTTGRTRNPPDPPEDPEDFRDNNPPVAPEPDPTDDPTDDPPESPFGCGANDNARWYNGSCPAGMVSLGFAELPGGSTMSLCTGGNLPPGDGCPEVPDEYGWECVNGSCNLVPFGLYATRQECLGSCQAPQEPPLDPNDPDVPLRYDCVGAECVASPTGVFATLEECQESCAEEWAYDPNGGGPGISTCVLSEGGEYSSQGACELDNGLTPDRSFRVVLFDSRAQSGDFTPGQCLFSDVFASPIYGIDWTPRDAFTSIPLVRTALGDFSISPGCGYPLNYIQTTDIGFVSIRFFIQD